MSMSDHERALLVTGTLDTSGVGGSPYARLDMVAVAFGAETAEASVAEEVAEPEEKAAENSPSVPEPKVEERAQARTTTKRSPAKKAQASAPAEK
jgi:hypothetical protein